MNQRITHELTDSDHFVEGYRSNGMTEILENCHCALWTLWKQDYDFCEDTDIPVSVDTFRSKVDAFTAMTQAERTQSRKYVADGLYAAEGVDIPCPVCGFHQPEEAIDVSNQ